ncbi:tRNA lysidine(34) synthetase TilS [Candidatus Epulonipiscium viviparus]|uniref:tRNA lysidine(34) synthetase TilS n=1 Tax=Candidatus Epulonipiscium viviparus TaxID=420336 RepID=UPI00016C046F|nr:tRNA lysidine(34) synthetase TilS [Candidatus Epulopiscium viviparus]
MHIQIIENKILDYIKGNDLINIGDEIVVAVSGGADSMMLLDYLYRNKNFLYISIRIAHVNHKMRVDAEKDMEFVKNYAKEREIICDVLECDIEALAAKTKMSSEAAGRKVRYEFFESLPHTKIATAHTANDQAETVLMRFLRGSDVKGLSGINAKRENIIRPILCITREEVEFYCNHHGIEYKTDHTNFLEIYTRNKIRLSLIPYITKNINANIMHTLIEHSKLYREEEEFLSAYTKKIYDSIILKSEDSYEINIEKFKVEMPYIQKKLLAQVIFNLKGFSYNITTAHLNFAISLVNKQSGKSINLPEGVKILRTQYSLVVYLENDRGKQSVIDLHLGKNVFEKYIITLTLVNKFSKKSTNNYTKYIDYDRIKSGLKVRGKQNGDRIGNKKLKKIFVDEKIPIHMRNHIPIIVDGNEVVCVYNRLNTAYYITDETTQILEIKIILGGLHV